MPDMNRFRRAFDAQLTEGLQSPGPAFTRRRVFGRIRMPGKVTAVIGMRRAGKTTFLQQLRAERIARGTPPWRLPFLRLEEERFAQLDAIALGELIDEYPSRYLDSSASSPEAWFLDEIQVVPGWERLLRRLLDTRHSDLFISGSSAALLSREIATQLRGRGWNVLIHPFSFEEALRHGDATEAGGHAADSGAEEVDGHAADSSAGATRLEAALLNWMRTGGFPEAQGLSAASRTRLLRDYVDVAILRDVVDRYDVRNVTGLRWLARHLLANAASSFSVERFHARLKSQGIAIARDTVHEYLGYLEDCFLMRTVWIETDSERRRMVNPRKAYPVDPALIPIFDRTGRSNVGHALETAVLIELERRGCEVTYVRTREGYEVDFLARSPSGETELIQVCADASSPKTIERELRALDVAGRHLARSREFSRSGKKLVTLTRAGLPTETPPGVEALSMHEWLLRSLPAFAEPGPDGWR